MTTYHLIQSRMLDYFLTEAIPDGPAAGLTRDRQANFGPRRDGVPASLSATGFGLLAVALAALSPYRLLPPAEAVRRVHLALDAVERLPHTAGVMPHFVEPASAQPWGADARSTIDTAWLVCGAFGSAELLADAGLRERAASLAARVKWPAWVRGDGLIRHGADRRGRPLACAWDRRNAETLLLCVLAAGAERPWPARAWATMGDFAGTVAGQTFMSADLGLFASQYGLLALDLAADPLPGCDLVADARLAAAANAADCRRLARRWRTFRTFWGRSAGDSPPRGKDTSDRYRADAPGQRSGGTAHLTATLASLEFAPEAVERNVAAALAGGGLLGRYGLASVNLDRAWRSADVVAIDLGAAALALDHRIAGGRVRSALARVADIRRGLDRLRAATLPDAPAAA